MDGWPVRWQELLKVEMTRVHHADIIYLFNEVCSSYASLTAVPIAIETKGESGDKSASECGFRGYSR